MNFNGDGNGEDRLPTCRRKEAQAEHHNDAHGRTDALGGLGVWLMVHRISAANADAGERRDRTSQADDQQFPGQRQPSIRSMEQMRNTKKFVQQFLNYPSMTQVPLSDLRTNPFRLKVAKTGGEDPNSLAERAANAKKKRVAALKAVQSLQLQSVMYGEDCQGLHDQQCHVSRRTAGGQLHR